MAKRGVDPVLLKERLLVSPACGLGNQDVKGAEAAFGLLGELSGCLLARKSI